MILKLQMFNPEPKYAQVSLYNLHQSIIWNDIHLLVNIPNHDFFPNNELHPLA